MYVRFYHGRKTVEEQLDGWGTEGPVIGPVSVSWTYGKLRLDMEYLVMREDLIYFQGVYYGDFEILDDNSLMIQEALKNGELVSGVMLSNQLKLDREDLEEAKCPQILILMKGGLIQETIATEKVKIKVVDFDVFDGGDPEPYDTHQFRYPDSIVPRVNFEHTHIRISYDRQYKEFWEWFHECHSIKRNEKREPNSAQPLLEISGDKEGVIQLAKMFASVLKEWLSPEQFNLVINLNKTEVYSDDICASHEFCDANMAMFEAFSRLFKREIVVHSDDDTNLWNSAWATAKKADFFRDTPL